MSRDGSGNYTRVAGPYVGGTTILKDNINDEYDDIATALSDSINKAGTKVYAANQPMGGFKFTGLAAGDSNGDSVRFEQLAGFQASDATLTALAALAWSSGVAVLTMTAADTFALKLIGTSGDTIPKNNTENVYSATQFFEMSGTSYTARHSNTTTTHDMGARWQSAGTLFTYTPIPSGSEDTAEDFGYDFTNGYWFFDEAPRVGTAPVLVSGTQQIPIPAGAMIPATTNGAAIGTTETTTNKVMLRTLDFDTTTQEFAHFSVAMPKGWNEGTVTFQPIWTADSGSGTVVFALQGIAFSDDDALDTAFGTEQTSSDTLLTAGDAHIGPVSSAITIGGTPAEGDIVFFRVKRVPASDTLGVDARLIGIRLIITTNAPNDA